VDGKNAHATDVRHGGSAACHMVLVAALLTLGVTDGL